MYAFRTCVYRIESTFVFPGTGMAHKNGEGKVKSGS